MYLLRPIVVGEIHFTYYRRWINEPNKMSFFVTILVVPLSVIFLTPWLDGKDQISINFTTAIQLVLSLIAYWQIVEIENQYRTE